MTFNIVEFFTGNKEVTQFNDDYLRRINIIIPLIYVLASSVYFFKDLAYNLDRVWLDALFRFTPIIFLSVYFIKPIRTNAKIVKFLLITFITISLIFNTLSLNFSGFHSPTYGSGISCGFAIIGFLSIANFGISFTLLILYAGLNIILNQHLGFSFAHIDYAVNPLRPMFSYVMVYLGCVVFSMYIRYLLLGLYKEKIKIEKVSITDALTGCYNRLYLNNINEIKNKTVLMCDVNKFKLFNDTYGHDIGDKVLVSVVDTINSFLPLDSSLIRYGGDEFVIITDQDLNVDKFAKCLNGVLGKTIIDDTIYEISISIGRYIIKNKPMNIYDAIKKADKTMYTYKK